VVPPLKLPGQADGQEVDVFLGIKAQLLDRVLGISGVLAFLDGLGNDFGVHGPVDIDEDEPVVSLGSIVSNVTAWPSRPQGGPTFVQPRSRQQESERQTNREVSFFMEFLLFFLIRKRSLLGFINTISQRELA